jgi:hypothetical protein
MPLPFNEWQEIVGGPGTWKLIRVLFRDELEEALESRSCVFSIIGSSGESNHTLKVSIEKVRRIGNEDGQGYFFYDIEGYVLEVDDEKWPLCVDDYYRASYDPERRVGSLKTFKPSAA